MELKKYKLGEILDVTRGASLSGEFYATEGKYIRLTCGNFDYQNNCFKENKSKDNIYYVGDFKPEFLMEKGDIITPLTEQAIGLLGSTAIIPESSKYIQSQDVAKIICKENLLDKDFAFYLISSALVKQQLSAAAQQTKIRHTSPDKIKDCTVWIPELSEQKRIGKLLCSIDRKIELNRAINQNLSAIELFEQFINEAKININGKSMSVCDFFDTLIDAFKQVFSKSVQVEIDYIGEVLERIRPAKGFVPILTLITDYQPLSKERIKTLIDFLGMPYSYTDNGDFNPPPSSLTDSSKLSDDMLALIGHNALFTYLTGLHKCGYVCPLHSFCEKQNCDKEECYDEPWNGKMCPMTIMGDLIHIKEKEVRIQF